MLITFHLGPYQPLSWMTLGFKDEAQRHYQSYRLLKLQTKDSQSSGQ